VTQIYRGRGVACYAPAIVLLLAFALRIYQLDAVRAYFDFALPHSLGIHILESIVDGRWGDLPLLGIGSGALLKNPIGASYFWAVIELFDRDPYIANIISALCSVLAVAMMYDLGRRLFERTVGLAAMFLTAVSPWGIFYARGTWIQGQLEFASIGAAWLILIAFQQRNPRRLLVGLIFTALMMQTYLMTMGLIALVFVAGGIALLKDRTLLKPFAIGFGVCAVSLVVFLGLSLTQPGNVQSTLATGFGTRDQAINKTGDRWQVAQLALRRTLEDVSGLGFNADFTDATDGAYAIRQTLETARGKLIELLIGLGALMAAARAIQNKQRVVHLQLLAWFGLPMLIAVALNFSTVLFKAGHYMLIAQPATALFAALPVGWLAGVVDGRSVGMRRVFRMGFAACMAAVLALSGVMVHAHATAVLQKPHLDLPSYEMLGWYPLRTQRQLAAQWHRECKEVASETYGMLIASTYQTTRNVRELAARFGDFEANKNSDVWQIRPDGGTCVTRANQPAPLWADAFDWPMPDGITVTTYRSKSVVENELVQSLGVTNAQPLSLNLGWTLLAVTAPQQVRAGDAFSAAHIWRIDALPTEPYTDWNYTVFAKLALPDGQRVTLADHVWLPVPKMWRVGDYVLQVARLRMPENLPPGNYTLELSLFDDKAMRNAAYFDAREPGKPIVVLERRVQVVASR
jgi:Dolichyl-phosphate-mannose-protein mannosyltransferase